jgi:hypothetical protein
MTAGIGTAYVQHLALILSYTDGFETCTTEGLRTLIFSEAMTFETVVTFSKMNPIL